MANPFSEVGGQLASRLLTGTFWFLIGFVFVIGIVGLALYIRYRRKFDITVEIKSERAGGTKIFEDKAAILYDKKDKMFYFKILKSKVELPVPPYEVLEHTNKGDRLRIWRKGEEEFIYLLPPTINRDYIVRHDGRTYKLADGEHKQLEGDVMYWNIKRKQLHRKMFDTESLLMKILPFMPHIIGAVVTFFMLYILLDSMPTILTQLTELVKELKSLKAAEVTIQGLIWPLTI